MKKRNRALLFGLFLLLLTGCGGKNKKDAYTEIKSRESRIYYLDGSESKLVSEVFEPEGTATDEQIVEYMDAMQQEPSNITYKKALQDPIQMIDYQLSDKGQLILNFSEEYYSLTGTTEILSRAAIVKTIGQIEGVEYIEFHIDGQPLMLTAEKAVGFMTPEDFIDNTGGETNFFQNATLTLFFAKKNGKKLQEIRVNVVYDGTISMEQLVMEQLIAGPSSIEGVDSESVLATIPKDTKVIKTSVKDSICYLDLNKEFLNKIEGISSDAKIYSVVNSLVELSAVDKVQITINGEKMNNFKENSNNIALLERNLDIVE